MKKVQKEANLYKDLPTKKLKKVIREYKFLVSANSRNFNFLFTLVTMLIPYLLVFPITPLTFILLIIVHYYLFDVYLFEQKNWKLVSDKEKNEMEQIVVILESFLKDRKTNVNKTFWQINSITISQSRLNLTQKYTLDLYFTERNKFVMDPT